MKRSTYKDIIYGSSNKSPTTRDFLGEEEFDYEKDNTPESLNDFLSSLDYENNQFFNLPKIMVEEVFKGTPYKYN